MPWVSVDELPMLFPSELWNFFDCRRCASQRASVSTANRILERRDTARIVMLRCG